MNPYLLIIIMGLCIGLFAWIGRDIHNTPIVSQKTADEWTVLNMFYEEWDESHTDILPAWSRVITKLQRGGYRPELIDAANHMLSEQIGTEAIYQTN